MAGNTLPLSGPISPTHTAWRGIVVAVLLPFGMGCQGDHLTPPPPIDPAVLYWNLELSHHAVTLSTTAP